METLYFREEEEETYTHTPPMRGNREPAAGHQGHHEATAGCVAAPAPQLDAMAALRREVDSLTAKVVGQTRRGTNTELAGLASFSPDIRGAIMPETHPEEHIAEFESQMSFHQPGNKVYCRPFPASLAGPTLKWFNRLPEGCVSSFVELKNRFTRTYVGMVQQDKDEHSVMTIRQRENELIASFQERFQMEFNLIPGANQKIAVISFVEGLRMCKFKESLFKRHPQNLEELNERAYKYIWIEEAEKSVGKDKAKRQTEEHRRKSLEPRRRSALDMIRGESLFATSERSEEEKGNQRRKD
ncbi:hypothetical protein LIER_38252 [Lithospermum erythrorhizon]|uniref:Retrotransposon gag domain-containing protein n=1 Tax=Lithospermum erythrorhizon TaxID=34254 RepID=A0AAV3PWZ3_LITER